MLGTWELTREWTTKDGKQVDVVSADDLKDMRDLGLDAFINLNADASFEMYLFGDLEQGLWDAVSSVKIDLEFKDGTISAEVDGATMRIVTPEATLEFTKTAKDREIPNAEAREKAVQLLALLQGLGDKGDMVAVDDGVIADDNLCKIVVEYMMVSWDGRPGYVIRIENRGDVAIDVTAETFSVGGKVVKPTMYETVSKGETLETGLLLFSSEELGSSELSALVAVEGEIVVSDSRKGDELARYNFQM